MSKFVKKICPITGSDEIAVMYLDPDELVITQRKGSDGKYRRVMRPRKEVKGGLRPEVICSSAEIPALAKLPLSLRNRLMEEKKVWCKKKNGVCPLEQIV